MPAKRNSSSSTENSRDEEQQQQQNHNHGNREDEDEEEEEEEEEAGKDDDPELESEKERDPDEEVGEGEDDGDDDGKEVKREEESGGEGEDSKGRRSPSSTPEEKPEFVFVDLSEIRKDVQCPICLGIIKKTRTVMDCLHRFCRECIDKSMRLGNNECPACRKHCASRRSLRDDPNFDALIAALYPDIDKYEEEELAFHDEERARNKQIQASIAQISQRQSEALVKRRPLGKESAVITRTPRNHGRQRRNCRTTEHQASGCDDDNDDNNRGKDSSSADERCTEVRPKKRKRRAGSRSSQPSSSVANHNGNHSTENDLEAYRESRGISPGLVWNPEILAWGRGGARSHTRHGNVPGGNNKTVRNARLNRLVEYLRGLGENSLELDVHLKLVQLDTQSTQSLQQPYLCCRPSLLVKQLREYIALQMHLEAEDIELLMVKAPHDADSSTTINEMQSLDDLDTLAGLKGDSLTSCRDHLVVAYRRKQTV